MDYIRETGKFEVVDVQWWTGGTQGEKKTPYVELGLVVEKESVKYMVAWKSWLTDSTSERTVNAILDLGFIGDGPEDFVNNKKDLFKVPKGVTVTVIAEEYNGKTYFKGSFINKSSQKEVGDIAKVLTEAGFHRYKAKHAQRNPPVIDTFETETIPF